MSESSSSSGNSGDSYIGSVVSLISKYEIRYEGVLYCLNIQDSTLGLKNVRSYGTEGRKKDGPQIPASDKVYEYILFRGSDIKDLQVKSSPPKQTGDQIYSDPAIIQSHIVEAPSSSQAAKVGGRTSESTQWLATPAVNSRVLPGALTSAPVVGSPNSAVSSFTSSLDSQVYDNASVLSRSQPGPLEYHLSFTSPLGTHNHLQNHEHTTPMRLVNSSESVTPQHSSTTLGSMHPSIMSAPAQISTPYPSSVYPPLPSQAAFVTPDRLAPVSYPLSSIKVNSFEAPIFGKAFAGNVVQSEGQVFPSTQTMYSDLKGLPTGSFRSATSEVPIAGNSVVGTASNPAQLIPRNTSSRQGSASGAMLMSPATLLTPDQIMQDRAHKLSLTDTTYPNYMDIGAGSSILASVDVPNISKAAVDMVTKPALFSTGPMPHDAPSLLGSTSAPMLTPRTMLTGDQIIPTRAHTLPLVQIGYPSPKDVSTGSLISAHGSTLSTTPVTQPPLLPLPIPSQQLKSSPVQFTEEFDFEAMNEKFKKDEVWGYLGKVNQVKQTDELGGLEDVGCTQDFRDVGNNAHRQPSNFDAGPAYKKDDFFDTISSNSVSRGSRNGQGRFSERMKLDTETFGNFQRKSHFSHGSYGRYSAGYGENQRDFYYRGRGFGYGGRGRG